MKHLRLLWVFALCIALLPTHAFAWGPIGHMTVDYVAYQKLTPAAKARIRELLQKNPDYACWVAHLPNESSKASQETQDMMLFMIAATWPDDIKGSNYFTDDGSGGGNIPDNAPGSLSAQNIGYTDRLRHKYWHFVDLPDYAEPGAPRFDTPAPNAITQIAALRAVLATPDPTDPKQKAKLDLLKSYDLAWLLHLIGDIHQPLHSTTRVSQADPAGDAGGNFVHFCEPAKSPDAQPKCSPLHAFWDDLPGADATYCADKISCVRRAIALGSKLAPSDPALAANLDPAQWAQESFQQAKANVYIAPVGPSDGPFTDTPAYHAQALKLAHAKVALAGARLANLLNAELK